MGIEVAKPPLAKSLSEWSVRGLELIGSDLFALPAEGDTSTRENLEGALTDLHAMRALGEEVQPLGRALL